MKKSVILIGGGDSFSDREQYKAYLRTCTLRDDPTNNTYVSWKHSLVTQLSDQYLVDIPEMPNKQNAHYDEWEIWFKRHLDLVDTSVILIGYSLGAIFLAKYLIENVVSVDVKHLFLLAGPCGYFEDEGGGDCASFGFTSTQLESVAKQVQNITIMHSTDDKVVPYKHALQYKQALPHAELVTFTDKNHFFVEELPELVERIKVLT